MTVIDENLPKGEHKLVQEGRAGLVEKVYQLTYRDGVLVKTDLISVKELRPALEQIIHVGSQVSETKEIALTSVIPYNTIVREDKFKPVTYRLVEVEGREGTQTDYYQVTYVNSKETQREYLRTVITTQPVTKVLVVGAGVERTVLVTEEEVISHQTEYRNDDTLQEGVTKVFQEGQDGLIHKTFEKYYFNDEERSATLVDTKVIRKAVNRVILIGTKRITTITTEELIQVEEVAFEKQTVENPKFAKGTQILLQKGKSGKRQYMYRLTVQNGVVIKKELIRSEILEESQSEIIEIGTLVEQSKQELSAPVEIIPTDPSPKLEEMKPLAVSAQEPQTPEAPVVQDQHLPETGDQSNWWISLLGSLILFLTFVGLVDKKHDY